MIKILQIAEQLCSEVNKSINKSILDFILNLKKNIFWFDPEDLEACSKFSKQYSLRFDENVGSLDNFIRLFQNKIKEAYTIGVNDSNREVEELFKKTVYVEDMDLKRLNIFYTKYKNIIEQETSAFFNILHDLHIDNIMMGKSVISLYEIFHSDKFQEELKATRETLQDMIKFGIKETYNISKLHKYKQARTGWYAIERGEEEKPCDIRFDDVAISLKEEQTIFPPFNPDCTCHVSVNEIVLDQYLKKEKQKSDKNE